MNSLIKWSTEHPVVVSLSMIFVVMLGVLSAIRMPQQTFPEFTLDVVSISVAYPGASAAEIQASIVRPIEDKLAAISEIDEITANISEGRGGLSVTFQNGQDMNEMLDKVKTLVDQITVFPEDALSPQVVRPDNNSRVIEIILHGNASDSVLKAEAQRLRDEITLLDGVSYAEVGKTRDFEIRIEISRDALRAYAMTLDEVAAAIRANSLELPGGTIETDTISIPLRTAGRNFTKSDFEAIVIRTNETGAKVYLRDVARVIDGFEESDLSATFRGAPAVTLDVFRVGDEQVLTISDQVTRYLEEAAVPNLPDGLDATVWRNDAESLQSRLDLLLRNALAGLALVTLALALFLDLRLALWSAVSIGISFSATLIAMSLLGMSINQISLFGFILAIGIVVDNAIVVSEKIYSNAQEKMPTLQAAVKGAQRVAVPVIFSTATTIVAFWPLLQLPGTLGKFLADIPMVVMMVLFLSMLQALLVLPRNLSQLDFSPTRERSLVLKAFDLVRRGFDAALQWFIHVPLDAVLRRTTRGFAILIPLAFSVALIANAVGLLSFGYVKFKFFPSIEDGFVTAQIEMNEGSAVSLTETVAEQVRRAAERAGAQVQATLPDTALPVVTGINVVVGQGAGGGGPEGARAEAAATLASVVVQLTDPELRSWPNDQFETAWREAIGSIAGVKNLVVSSELIGGGDPVAVELSLPDGQHIGPVVAELRAAIEDLPGVYGITDDHSSGQLDYELALRPEARVYGLSLQDVATQTRAGFFGIEATRVQRGGDDVKVMVSYPAEERDTLADLRDTLITTPAGDQIPLSSVATIAESRVASNLLRRDGRQITTVTASLDTGVASSGMINGIIGARVLPPLQEKYPGLIVQLGGEQRQQGDAQTALGTALGIALFVIYALLALVFRSYVQPVVVMFAIPLGLVGAITGHYIIGIPLTILSIFGIIGLAGVVINNSLVMVDVFNEKIAAGVPVQTAVIDGTKDRFRPILLTSLTTFLGIYPLTLETSLQAQFLIPLAVSIGYGVLFGMFLIVLAVPSLFMLVHYLGAGFGAAWRALAGTPAPSISTEGQNHVAPVVTPIVPARGSRALAAE